MNDSAARVEHNILEASFSVEHIYQGRRWSPSEERREYEILTPVFAPRVEKPLPAYLEYEIPRSLYYIIQNSALSPSIKWQALYFVNLVFRGPKTKDGHYTKKNRGLPCPLHSKALDDVMRSKSRVFRFLIPKYIEQDKSYQVGVTSKRYSLQPDVKTKSLKKYTLEDQALIRKILTASESKNLREIKEHERKTVFLKLYEDLKQVTPTYKAIGLFCGRIEQAICEGRDHRSLELALNRMLAGDLIWSLAKNGRLYTSVANLPELVRAHLLAGGEPVVEIDLTNSHPAILTTFAHAPEEKRMLQALTSKGVLYAAFECFWEFDKDKVWDEGDGCHSFKQLIQKIINGPPRPNLRTYRELRSEFPRLMATISNFKSKSSYSAFAQKIQGIEASIIANIVEQLQGIVCFTTYDGIAVPKCQQVHTEALFREETKKALGFSLPARVKPLQIPEAICP